MFFGSLEISRQTGKRYKSLRGATGSSFSSSHNDSAFPTLYSPGNEQTQNEEPATTSYKPSHNLLRNSLGLIRKVSKKSRESSFTTLSDQTFYRA